MNATTTETPSTTKKNLTPEDVAAELGVTKEAVRDWLTYGVIVTTPTGRKRIALRGRKVGGRWRVSREDLDAFTKVTTEASASPNALPPAEQTESESARRARGQREKAATAKRLAE